MPVVSGTGEGAIAQLGERLHGMQEVGGSIPPGSTSLRRLRLLRLGKPYRSKQIFGLPELAGAPTPELAYPRVSKPSYEIVHRVDLYAATHQYTAYPSARASFDRGLL